MFRQAWLITVVGLLLIGCAFVLVVGCSENTGSQPTGSQKSEDSQSAEADDSLPKNGKIVFQRISTTSPTQHIYTVDPDGSNLNNLTNDSKENDLGIEPAWSPDGTKIAYVSFGPRITVMEADGSNKKKLSMHSGFTDPTWSADGTQLAFSTSTPVQSITPDIYTSDADGSDLTNLTKSPEVDESKPAVSTHSG